ncbi:hypothetical protein HKX42_02465 [Salinisphaera sp. USBA-960]|uniref:PRC-barrel domain-containing protein n=1 Tax=Salinisphaera orenii TaxID=856731 RepID=UPI000DBE96D6|nr:hypothetical protein [Salifodinibacter halophilus]NNC25739.1 hypothetical protein [Salifodinibacter halophilus]
MQHSNNKTLGLIAPAALAIALAVPGTALANNKPQGLYSADQLLDADVYTKDGHKQVGELDDIVFDNSMRISSFVVESDDTLGLDGKSYVVNTNQVRVKTQGNQDSTHPDYTVIVDMSAKQLKDQPVYSNSWWTKSKKQASDAWQKTKDSANSAWTNIKQGSQNLYESAKNAVHSAAESAADVTGN